MWVYLVFKGELTSWFYNQIKYSYTPKMESQKAVILKQMEYYLSDKNLAKDDFFRKLIDEDKKTGYIKLETF